VGSEDEGSETSGDGFETMPGVVKTGGKLKGHNFWSLVVSRWSMVKAPVVRVDRSRKYARKMNNAQLPLGGRGSGRQPRKVDRGRWNEGVLRIRGCPFSLSSMLRLWSDRRRRRGVAARRIDGEQRDLWRDFRFQKAVWFVCSSLPNGRTYALCWG